MRAHSSYGAVITFRRVSLLSANSLPERYVYPTSNPSGGGGGGCFIATAAYGSSLDKHIAVLKNFRDKYLLTNFAGKAFLNLYYKYSPSAADFIRRHDTARAATRFVLTSIIFTIKYPFVIMLFLMFAAGLILALGTGMGTPMKLCVSRGGKPNIVHRTSYIGRKEKRRKAEYRISEIRGPPLIFQGILNI